MKDIARQELSIHIEVMDMLNDQIQKEAQSSTAYLAMASWCDQQGLENSAQFFYAQAEEERTHMMKIFRFINDNGGNAMAPATSAVNHDFTSLEEVFSDALAHEVGITKSIHKLVAKSRAEHDYATDAFLQWFVTEQMEEEQTMRRALDILKLGEKMSLLQLDERIAELNTAQ
ncbi:ferritin [Mesonia hippocampi]|uniref:Ferritin n=1 Tax=Mesonia hippocampi TaxID=1628250 RepID=A0A840ENJ2_9FLAO|nr:ferritin [Mesonia hippocampi]MBB4119949.1 ferritin [Mesonia hippocampi]